MSVMASRPKRPLSAYMIWLSSARENIKAENPGIKVTEIAKKGGEIWRGMKDKSEWEAKAAKAKSEYSRAVEEFEANGGGAREVKTATKRGKKAAKKPVPKSKKKKEESEEEESEEEESE